jgi:hypothetical protein
MKLSRYIINREAHLKFKLDPQRDEFYERFIRDAQITHKTQVSQDYRELNSFMDEKDVRARTSEFNPAGNWGYVNLVCMKFHFTGETKKYKIGSQIYSSIPCFSRDGVIIIDTDRDDVEVHIIPEVSTDRIPNSLNLIVQYIDISYLNESIRTKLSSLDLKLRDDVCIDWHKLILNENGIYINRKARATGVLDVPPYQPTEGDFFLHTPFTVAIVYKGETVWSLKFYH